MGNRNLNDLHPILQPLCRQLLDQLDGEDVDARVTFTWRSAAEQDALYAQGRTKPGKIVTNARADQSKHCFTINGAPAAKAFDIAIVGDDGKLIADGDDPAYQRAGQLGKALGLVWGGDWQSIKDAGHFEIT